MHISFYGKMLNQVIKNIRFRYYSQVYAASIANNDIFFEYSHLTVEILLKAI